MRDEACIPHCAAANQRERAGSGLHPVAGINIILNQNRNAVKRSTQFSSFAFRIKGIRYAESFWIYFKN